MRFKRPIEANQALDRFLASAYKALVLALQTFGVDCLASFVRYRASQLFPIGLTPPLLTEVPRPGVSVIALDPKHLITFDHNF